MQLLRCGRSTESTKINNNKTMSDFPKDAPSIRDKDAPHKKIKKTNVKNYPGLGIAPTIREQLDDLYDDPLQELYLSLIHI